MTRSDSFLIVLTERSVMIFCFVFFVCLRMKRASSLNFLNKSVEETSQVSTWTWTRTHAALCVVTELHDLYSVFSGSKQWPVRMSRTEHQQRGPFKTKLPDWLESAVGVIKEERSKADTLFALCIQIRTMLCYVI